MNLARIKGGLTPLTLFSATPGTRRDQDLRIYTSSPSLPILPVCADDAAPRCENMTSYPFMCGATEDFSVPPLRSNLWGSTTPDSPTGGSAVLSFPASKSQFSSRQIFRGASIGAHSGLSLLAFGLAHGPPADPAGPLPESQPATIMLDETDGTPTCEAVLQHDMGRANLACINWFVNLV